MQRYLGPWRLFFPSAVLLAPLNVVAWLAARQGLLVWPAASAGWHGLEMVFGYSFAIIAGYLLPAMPLPFVLALWMLWLAGRLAWFLSPVIAGPWLQLLAGAAFPAALAVLGARRFRAVKRARNLAFPLIMVALGAAACGSYAVGIGWLPAPEESPAVLSVYLVALLVMVMGGRAVPTATVGSLRAEGRVLRVMPHPALELVGILGMLALLVLDALGFTREAGLAALAVAGMLVLQMAGWQTGRVFKDPETWPLHLGFVWLVLGLVMIGLQALGAILIPEAGALHALAAGGIGTVTLVMLLRVTRQRAGDLRVSRRYLQVLQVSMAVAVAIRVAGGWALPGHRALALWLSAAAWAAAFGLGTAIVVPAALRPER